MCKFAPKISGYAGTQPSMAFDQFFDGRVKAHGIVQNRAGRVIERFDIDMMTSWQGDKGTLQEEFTYYDGRRQSRTWHITKTGNGTFAGHSDDIVGEATGESAGCAIGFRYVLKVPVGGKTYNLSFDDRMYMMNDGVIINRAVMRKFGIRVGEVTVVMQKIK
ncbi:MAG TPA: DUF3833 domain-containing protein [Patescibacteria group bacterium]|nr:DUF3833 domain-containing protein [Patescibacteria group bacterium]